MPPDDDARLRHLIEAAETAVSFARGRSRADLDGDQMLVLALTKLVEIVGEAAKQVSPATKDEFPTCLGLRRLTPGTGLSTITSTSTSMCSGRPWRRICRCC